MIISPSFDVGIAEVSAPSFALSNDLKIVLCQKSALFLRWIAEAEA